MSAQVTGTLGSTDLPCWALIAPPTKRATHRRRTRQDDDTARRCARRRKLGMSGMDEAIDKLEGGRFRSRALPSTSRPGRGAQDDQSVRHERTILQSAPNGPKQESGLLFFLAAAQVGLPQAGSHEPMVNADASRCRWPGRCLAWAPGCLNFCCGSQVRCDSSICGAVRAVLGRNDLTVCEEVRRGHAALHLSDRWSANTLLSRQGLPRKFRPIRRI